MLIRLIRNQPQGSAITGRLVINGRWFCNTLERVGYQIPALCYHVIVTQSPKFKRLLPLVTGVPRLPIGGTPSNSEASDRAKPVQYPAAECRTGIRFHRGSKPEHSTGCILVVADNPSRSREFLSHIRSNDLLRRTIRAAVVENNVVDNSDPCRGRDIDCRETLSPLSSNNNPERELCCCERNVVENNVVDVVVHSNPCRSRDIDSSGMLSPLSSNNNSSLSSNKKNIGCRSAADVEQSLTQLLLQTQESHEEIILEVIDFRPGTDYGYDTPCPPELQKP